MEQNSVSYSRSSLSKQYSLFASLPTPVYTPINPLEVEQIPDPSVCGKLIGFSRLPMHQSHSRPVTPNQTEAP